MKETQKSMVRPYVTFFVLSLCVAVIARIGLWIMHASNILAYDYISASGVPILDVICSILTGSAFVAFLFAAGLCLVVFACGILLHGYLFSQKALGAGSPLKAFLWGWATAAVALICMVVVISGILSSVQMASMSSKLPGIPLLLLALIVFAAFLGTLVAASSMVLCACIAKAKDERQLSAYLVIAMLVGGLVVMLVTIQTFAAINSANINLGSVGLWFGIDLVVNLAILFGAATLMRKGKLTTK